MTLDRSFDVDDRLDDSITLIAPAADNIAKGTTFVVSDGVSAVTFEFVDYMTGTLDDPSYMPVYFYGTIDYTFSDGTLYSYPGDTASVVAGEIADAINKAEKSGLFHVTATTNGNSDIVDLFNAAWATNNLKAFSAKRLTIRRMCPPTIRTSTTLTADRAVSPATWRKSQPKRHDLFGL